MMLVNSLSLLAMAAAVSAYSSAVTPAPAVTNCPSGASYVATLPKKSGNPLCGSISAASAADGKGVRFSVSIAGLPAEGGPFMYHIHAKPVPADGNCTATGAHLDPYNRGEVPICDASKPETCQTGDLSGKHGNITAQTWSQEYVDLFASTNKNDPSYFGNLSFVVHLANKTRIGCANFISLQPGASANVSGTAYSSANISGSTYPSASATTGSIAKSTVKPTYDISGPAFGSKTASSSPTSTQFSGNAVVHRVGGSTALLAVAVALLL